MSKVTVKVEIASGSPDALIALGTNIEKNHTSKGSGSPLTSTVDMASFSEKLKLARELREQAKKLRDEAEKLNQQANLYLGIDKSQNSKTQGTLYNLITSIRDILLGINRGQEENLNEWGFKVVSGTAQAKTKTAPKP